MGCALNCAEMLSASKALFVNVLSALKFFKSQGLLHNPTFWSWECGKVLPWFFVGFSLVLNVDFLFDVLSVIAPYLCITAAFFLQSNCISVVSTDVLVSLISQCRASGRGFQSHFHCYQCQLRVLAG